MAAKIKYTIVPKNILEDAIYESGIALTENAIVVSYTVGREACSRRRTIY